MNEVSYTKLDIYRALDIDCDDRIDREEFETLLHAVEETHDSGLRVNFSAIDFSTFDKDGSGYIDSDEFEDLITVIHEMLGARKFSSLAKRVVTGRARSRSCSPDRKSTTLPHGRWSESRSPSPSNRRSGSRSSKASMSMSLARSERPQQSKDSYEYETIWDPSCIEIQFEAGDHGMIFVGGNDRSLKIKSVKQGSQAALKGVVAGWKVRRVNRDVVSGEKGLKALEAANRMASWKHTKYSVVLRLGAEALAAIQAMTKSVTEFLRTQKTLDLQELADVSQAQRKDMLMNADFGVALVHGHCIHEVEVLTREKTPADLARFRVLLNAVKTDNAPAVQQMVDTVDLLQRDEHGNVPLHYARSGSMAKVLLKPAYARSARSIQNFDAETPAYAYLAHVEVNQDEELVKDLLGDNIWDALALAEDGVCPAMRLESVRERLKITARIPRWSDILIVLRSSSPRELKSAADAFATEYNLLPSTICSPEDMQKRLSTWGLVLPWHCFMEAFCTGCHTEQSRTRLLEVWACIKRLLIAYADSGDSDAEDVARQLLQATKGPLTVKGVSEESWDEWDPRMPYRHELNSMMESINDKAVAELRDAYNNLDSDKDVVWLKRDLLSSFHPGLILDPLLQAARRDEFNVGKDFEDCPDWLKLRMDFSFSPMFALELPDFPVPGWVHQLNTEQVLKSLEQVSMVGAFRPGDAAFDMLSLASNSEVSDQAESMLDDCMPGQLSADEVLRVRWYAAWLQGFCSKFTGVIAERLSDVMHNAFNREKGSLPFYARSEAKSLPRIMEKTFEAIDNVLKHYPLASQNKDLRWVLISMANIIVDIFGCTVVVESLSELRQGYEALMNLQLGTDGVLVLRTSNGFHGSRTRATYRDLKVWIAICIPLACVPSELKDVVNADLPLLVEVQLHLDAFHAMKKIMHLPYEYHRGSLDWTHRKQRARQKQKVNHQEVSPQIPKEFAVCLTTLFDWIRWDHPNGLPALQSLIANDLSPEICGEEFGKQASELLFFKARNGFSEVAIALSEKGARSAVDPERGSVLAQKILDLVRSGEDDGHQCLALLRAGAKAKLVDSDILKKAIEKGLDKVCQALIQEQVGLTCMDVNGWTPVFHACIRNKHTLIGDLAQAKADLSHKDHLGMTALHVAVEKLASEDCVRSLLQAKVDPASRDEQNQTPEDRISKRLSVLQTCGAMKQSLKIKTILENGRTVGV